MRLVVPGDDLGGRSTIGVVDIQLRNVPSTTAPGECAPSESIELGGLLERPTSLRVDDLARFDTHEVVAPPTIGHGGAEIPARRYSGVLLWDVLEDAGPVVNPEINEDILRKVVVARGMDGYASVLALGEVDPRFMGGQVLIATACEGGPLPDGEREFRLVFPYDQTEGRSIKSLRSIEIQDA